MHCETNHENNILVICIPSRETHFALATELRRQLFDFIAAGERRLLIDLSRCEYLDSTLLGVLVGAARKLHAVNGALKLTGVHRNVRRLLQLTNLNRVFEAYDNKHEALAAFYGCEEISRN